MMKSLIALAVTFAGFISSAYAQQSNYGQCGGIGWTGLTTCNSGWTCVVQNPYYSQCVPASTTPSSTSTTKPATTTTKTSTAATSSATSKGTFTNPIKTTNGSDPFMVYSNGYYYLTTTTWTNIQITRATTVSGLKTATPKVIWTDTTTDRCCNVWAPEIHWMATEGRWFIYYVAGSSDTLDNQRIHVLKSSGTDIWSSTWSYATRIVIPNRDVWSIDPTVLGYNGSNYLVYSGSTTAGQCLFIAKMSSATTVGNAVQISCPTYSWETIGAAVNEGPEGLVNNGRAWIFFSASYCWGTGYELGRLELTGSDPLSASSWTKYSSPVLTGANGNYEPGHNAFFTGPSGEYYIVYHASSTSPGTCDGARYTMVQPMSWASNGEPVLASPAPFSQAIPEPY